MEKPSLSSFSSSRFNIIYFANKFDEAIQLAFSAPEDVCKKASSYAEVYQMVSGLTVYELNVSILLEVTAEQSTAAFDLVHALKKNWLSRNLVVIFLLTDKNVMITKRAFEERVSDCYNPPINFEDVKLRIQYLSAYKLLHAQLDYPEQPLVLYKIPIYKRLFDLIVSIGALIFLSPLILVIAILIKIDSKGPVFYTSKRVGTGYKIFDFYKFRSMRINADQEVEKLKSKSNQYGDSAFFKMKNDPRVTKFGNFLRNSSIDELPQLLNVIKGDMSIVGNRPLPLYEAEQLTTDEWAMRFLGPAGITGLWQIIKRGKSDMSDRERKKLDNFYNKRVSVWLDIKIIFMTIPALFQKEKV